MSSRSDLPGQFVQTASSSSSPDYMSQYKPHFQEPINFNGYSSHIQTQLTQNILQTPSHHTTSFNPTNQTNNSTHLSPHQNPNPQQQHHANVTALMQQQQQQQHHHQHQQQQQQQQQQLPTHHQQQSSPGVGQMPPPIQNFIYPWMRQAGNVKTSKLSYLFCIINYKYNKFIILFKSTSYWKNKYSTKR